METGGSTACQDSGTYRYCLHLVSVFYLTPDPSPARTNVNEINALLAGEGCIRDGAALLRRPISTIFPPLKQADNRMIKYGTV